MCVRSDYKHQDNNFVNFGLDISIRHSKLLKKTHTKKKTSQMQLLTSISMGSMQP